MKLISVNRFIRLTLLINILAFIFIYVSSVDLAQWINTGAYPFYFLEDNQVIYVDDTNYDGLSDTQRIDTAIADAARNNAKLIFGNKTYVYRGGKTINHVVHWQGTQPAIFDSAGTVIQIEGMWTFNGEGLSTVHGIAINGNRSFTGDVVRIGRRINKIEFNQCHFMGALHRRNSDPAIILNVVGNAGIVIFNNGSISDAHSESPIEVASADGSTAGGWRQWPSIRGFNASRFDGYLEMKNVDIFNIGHQVKYMNGDQVWDNPRQETLNPGGWDIDAWHRSGRTGSGSTHLEEVRFYSSPGSFIKISSHGGTLNFKDIDIHIREGEPVAGRPVRLQSDGSGFQRNGIFENVKIRADRSADLTHFGGGDALRMLISFSGNEPEEQLHLKNTVIEIGVDEDDPLYLNDMAVFGYHRTNSPKFGLIIENTQLLIPGGIEWFFRTSANANYSSKEALKRVNEVTFRDNQNMKFVRRFYYAHPFLRSCDECRVYTFHRIILEGENSYHNPEGIFHKVKPQISSSDIWRSGGGIFSDCKCEEDILNMYLFEIYEVN
jgi:hypothetical protein